MHVVFILSNRYVPGEGLTPFHWVPTWDGIAELGVRRGLFCFAFSLPGECVGESPCGIHLCFSEDQWWWSLLHVHTGHLESLFGGRAYISFFFNWVVCLFWLLCEMCLCTLDASPWGIYVLQISSPALWLTFWLNSIFRSAEVLQFNGVQGSNPLLCGYCSLCPL